MRVTGPQIPPSRASGRIRRPGDGRAASRILAARRTVGGALLLLALLFPSLPLQAEKYLTVEEAQKLVFPEADAFEEKRHAYTEEERKRISGQSGVRLRHKGQRFWVARRGGTVQGVLIFDAVIGKHELIDYVVGIDPAGKVLQVEILEYRESHGGQVRGVKWRNQFRGKTHASPLRLNEDIYNISGATLSSRHLTEGVRRLLAFFELVVRGRYLDGVPDGAR